MAALARSDSDVDVLRRNVSYPPMFSARSNASAGATARRRPSPVKEELRAAEIGRKMPIAAKTTNSISTRRKQVADHRHHDERARPTKARKNVTTP